MIRCQARMDCFVFVIYIFYNTSVIKKTINVANIQVTDHYDILAKV